MSISTRTIASIVLLSASLSACNAEQAPQTEDTNKSDTQQQVKVSELKIVNDMKEVNDVNETGPKESEEITLKGQVLFQEMEGGFFGFIDENGKKYTPMGMNKEYLRHGLVIELTGTPLPNMMTITQFGEVIKVSNVVILDESKALKAGRPKLNSEEL
ncbi:hypothetical protein [Glaciecola sp. MF2-115]|uniref:hypothetical protein n=1 Tax=Glaciecola sp. MF2-115 TaxID=3384827 RepID=UPI0039A23A25